MSNSSDALPHRGYIRPPLHRSASECARLSETASKHEVKRFVVAAKSGSAFVVNKGQTCRFLLNEGAQVGDVNLWNLENTKEHFYSGKTRQLESSHLTVGNRLWSNIPYVNVMATVIADSLQGYTPDKHGMGVHDVCGTRCDPYTLERITGVTCVNSCHQILTKAVADHGLTESDVHDVFNIFMCTGFDAQTQEYLIKGTPARKGDYIEILAEQNLLVALSVCPCGDVSLKCGTDVPDSLCHSIEVIVGDTNLIQFSNNRSQARLVRKPTYADKNKVIHHSRDSSRHLAEKEIFFVDDVQNSGL